jgi:hypothetical protein
LFKGKNRYRFWFLLAVILLLTTYYAVQYGSRIIPSPRPNPVRHLEEFKYYEIIDEKNGRTLTYISVPVSVGDEYVTENRHYVVVRINGNKAYAKYTGRVANK